MKDHFIMTPIYMFVIAVPLLRSCFPQQSEANVDEDLGTDREITTTQRMEFLSNQAT